MKKCLSISLSIVGAMVGVGLASGREVVSFFARFGFLSLIFCLISGLIVSLLCYLIFEIERRNNTHKKSDKYANNKKRKNVNIQCKNAYIAKICDTKHKSIDIFGVILFICQLSLCGAMFAGLLSIFKYFSFNIIVSYIFIFVVFVVAYFILSRKNTLVFSFNSFLVLVLLLFIFISFFIKISNNDFCILQDCDFSLLSIVMSILYAGMNVLTVYPLLKDCFKFIKNKKEELIISLLTGLFVFILLELVCVFVLIFGGGFISDDMIMLSIIGSDNKFLLMIFAIILIFCIFTTLLSTAYGASSFLKTDNDKFNVFICLLISLFLGFIGFSNIVSFVYPVLGFICIVFILLKFLSFN